MAEDLSGKIVLRWDKPGDCAQLLEAGGIDLVLPADSIRLCSVVEFGRAGNGAIAAVNPGAWPGSQSARRGADGSTTAGATERPWVTANGYLAPYLRALYPGCQPMIGYAGEGKTARSFDSLELTLADAWAAGGNCILCPDAAHRDALLAGNSAALAAWERMGRSARWLKEHRAVFLEPPLPAVTALVDSGDAAAEIANLMFRHSASPDLLSTSRPTLPDPGARAVISAAAIAPPSNALSRALLAYVRSGGVALTDAAAGDGWWRKSGAARSRSFEDREFYTLGRGSIVFYKEPIADPGDFALDALDLAGDRRPVRLWNCSAAIGIASRRCLRVVNYGSPVRGQALVRWHGTARAATLLRPGEPDVQLRAYVRGRNTEVVLPGLSRLALLAFD